MKSYIYVYVHTVEQINVAVILIWRIAQIPSKLKAQAEVDFAVLYMQQNWFVQRLCLCKGWRKMLQLPAEQAGKLCKRLKALSQHSGPGNATVSQLDYAAINSVLRIYY